MVLTVHTYLTYEDVFGRLPTEEELDSWVSRLSFTDCLHAIGKLSHAVASDSPAGENLIRQVIREGLPPENQARMAYAFASGTSTRAIFPKHLLALARVAILNAQDREPDSFGGGRDFPLFVAALLAVGDLYDLPAAEIAAIPNGLPAEEFYCSFRLRRLGMPGRNWLHTLVRTLRVFVDLPLRRPDLITAGRPSEVFESQVKLSLERYLAICLAAYIRFEKWDGQPDTWQLGQGWWAEAALEPEEIQRALATVSAPRGQLKLDVEAALAEGQTSLDDIRPFIIHPLARLSEDDYVPLDMQLLKQGLLGDGIFWRMRPSTQQQKSDFGESLGHLFEAHCLELVEACYAKASKHRKPYFPEFRYKVQTPEGEERWDAPDVIVTDPGASVFVEIGIDRINVRNTLGTGDMTCFRDDVRKIILHRAEQLSIKIDHAQSGEMPLAGSPKRALHTIYPMICLWDGFPVGDYLYDRIVEMVKKEGHLEQPGVAPLRIVSAEEFELLCALVAHGMQMTEILAAQGRSRWAKEPVGDFLRERYLNKLDLPEPMKSDFPKMLERLRVQIFTARI